MENGRLTDYLLGRLSSEEEDEVEREYFGGGEAYDRLLAAEDDLIDAYVAGRLAAEDTHRFEERFLVSADRRERVAFARALRTAAARNASPAVPRRRSFFLPIAAALPFALAAGWAVFSVRELRTELVQERAQQSDQARRSAEERARIASLEEELARVRSTSDVATWPVSPGLERDATRSTVVTVSPSTELVNLRLSITEPTPTVLLTARVETPEGRLVAEVHGLRARSENGPVVDLVLPASALAPGTYIVVLQTDGRSREMVDTYHVRVAAAR